MSTYKDILKTLEPKSIKKIEQYIADNNLTYTANSPDFIRGLILGLDVGTTTMYETLTTEVPRKSPRKSKKLQPPTMPPAEIPTPNDKNNQ